LFFRNLFLEKGSISFIRVVVSRARFDVCDPCVLVKGGKDEAAFEGLELRQDASLELFFVVGRGTRRMICTISGLIQVGGWMIFLCLAVGARWSIYH
jgi:hypothetical protein